MMAKNLEMFPKKWPPNVSSRRGRTIGYILQIGAGRCSLQVSCLIQLWSP